MHSRPRLAPPLLALVLLAACSRSPLQGAPGAGASGAGGAGGGPDAGPPPPCFLALAGMPAPLFAFPEGNTDAPDMVVLDPGDAAAGRPARVAYQAVSEDANFWHPELRVAGLRVDPPWPEGLTVESAPILLGTDAHAWGRLARRVGPGEGVALVWFRSDEAAGKPTGLKFRTLDAASWTPGPEVFIDPVGYAAYAFAPGGGLGPGGYEGEGYAVAYRAQLEDGSAEARVAVLDPAGAVLLGPLAAAAATEYPGRFNGVAWTGSTYLVAIAFDSCLPADSFCLPGSVVVARLRPPAGGDPGGLDPVASFPALDPGAALRRPYLIGNGQGAWLAWSEADPAEDGEPRAVRLARLDGAGNPAGAAVTLAEGARVATPVALAEAPVGVVVAWGEPGQPELQPHEIGAGRLVVHHRDPGGAPLGEPIALSTTGPVNAAFPAAVALAHPRGVLLTWAASGDSAGAPSQTFVARLDCRAAP